jgi:hypothetical protein
MGDYVRTENGKRGELKSRARLVDDFWIVDREIDADGVDFFIQPRARNQAELRDQRDRVGELGAIQAKFFEGTNQVRITARYILNTDSAPRRNYFVFLHTEDIDGEPIDYFFTAAQVASLWDRVGDDGDYTFSLAAGRTFDTFKDLKRNVLRTTIEDNIADHLRHVMRQEIFNLVSLHGLRRRAHDFAGRYVLCRPHNCAVALYVDATNGSGHPVEMRKDIFRSRGWFEWGYLGEGPKLLSASVLAHFFAGIRPSHDEVILLCHNLIGELNVSGAEFNATDIFVALAGLPYRCRFADHPWTQSLFDITKSRYLSLFAQN